MVYAECGCKNQDSSPVVNKESAGNITGPLPVSGLMANITSFETPTPGISSTGCRPASSISGITAEADTWPSPIISSLFPDSVFAGSESIILTIDGNNFIPETRVLWDAKDYTRDYLSPYQITAEIPTQDLGTPGQHFIWAYNPTPCGGNSNIVQFRIGDSGQSFPLTTSPLMLQVLKGQNESAAILVQNLPKGLLRYNLTLSRDSSSPFIFSFADLPSWVSNPQVTWLDNNRLLIRGEDGGGRIRNGTGEVTLVNISAFGNQAGSGYIQCTLNEAVADDGTRYGSGYTALPVTIGDILPFFNTSGGIFPPPTDPDRDGLYEDINGNKRLDLNDIVIFFSNLDMVVNHEPWWSFDFDRNRVINLNDVVSLFQMSNR